MPSTAFAARSRFQTAPGLRSGLSLHRLPADPGLRCYPSSLYTFPARWGPGLARDCHGEEVSPNLGSSASPVSRRALKLLPQVRCVCHSATPAWLSDRLSIIGQVCPDLHVQLLVNSPRGNTRYRVRWVKLPWWKGQKESWDLAGRPVRAEMRRGTGHAGKVYLRPLLPIGRKNRMSSRGMSRATTMDIKDDAASRSWSTLRERRKGSFSRTEAPLLNPKWKNGILIP